MTRVVSIAFVLISMSVYGQYSPAAGEVGSTAIFKDSSVIVGWANEVISFDPGPQNITVVGSPLVSFGDPLYACNEAEGNGTSVVSLGDGGSIVLGFNYPIKDGPGPDFAVFENGFDDLFLEFAHVEVSTDGITFVRIPSDCLIATGTQTGPFGNSNTELVHNLAGKFRQGYGTPFDLADVADSSGIVLDSINFVRVVDVIGSVDQFVGSSDADGDIINDPFPTDFETGGFDLDAIAVIHANGDYQLSISEPTTEILLYPNPTKGLLYIQGEYDGWTVRDQLGRLVLKGTSNIIDLSNYARGTYFICLDWQKGPPTRQSVLFED